MSRHPRTVSAAVAGVLGSLVAVAAAAAPAVAATSAAAPAVAVPSAAAPAVAAGVTGTIAGTGVAATGGTPLNMRRTPSSAGEHLGTVVDGGKLWIMCQVTGDRIAGTIRTTTAWDRLANGAYVADAYVSRSFTVPGCAGSPTIPAPVPAAAGAWQPPVPATLISGFRTTARPAHDGVDLAAARNTAVRAAAAGTVLRVVCNVSAGTCDVDGRPTLKGCGWYVEVRHAGDVVTRYCHLVRRPSVVAGQTVGKGQTLGLVGSSGSSSGPHLHFEVHAGAPATSANAVDPIVFMRARGVAL